MGTMKRGGAMKKFLGVCILAAGIAGAVWCFNAADKPNVQTSDFATVSEQNRRAEARAQAQKAEVAEPEPAPLGVQKIKAEDSSIANLPVRQTAAGRSLSREELAFFVAAQNDQRAREPDTATEHPTASQSTNSSITTDSREFQDFIALARELAATKQLTADPGDGSRTLSPEAQALADKAVSVASQFLTPEQTQKLQDMESNPDAMRKLEKAAGRVLGSRAGRNFLNQ
jgi:hypothetical protein